MKKIITIIILLISVCSLSAQTYKYYTNSFAYKYYENYRWSKWSDWERSHILVVINLDRNIINIYSEKIQEYDIYEYKGEEKDEDGGTSMLLSCVNQDGLHCQVRLRIQSDGSKQLYVDFSDLVWVYGLEER